MIVTKDEFDEGYTKRMYGKCRKCEAVFDKELRDELAITYCPYCGEEILDYWHDINPPPNLEVKPNPLNYVYCDACGTRIRKIDGARTIAVIDEKAGICEVCGQELCGTCGSWNDVGECFTCQRRSMSSNNPSKAG